MLNRPAHFMGKKGTHLLSRHRELLSSPLLLHHLRWFGPATYTRDKYRAAAVQYIAQRSSASGEVLATHNGRWPPAFATSRRYPKVEGCGPGVIDPRPSGPVAGIKSHGRTNAEGPPLAWFLPAEQKDYA